MYSGEEEKNKVLKEQRRRKRERILIFVIFAILFLVTFLEIRFSHFGDKLSLVNSIVFFGFKNFSIILVLLLLFLLTRNVVKTYLEHKGTIPGSRLRTKLVLVFIGFTVVPMVILFFTSVFFIESSFERWFSMRIERTFKESLDVANYLYKNKEEFVLRSANKLKKFIENERLFRNNKKFFLRKVLRDHADEEHDVDSVEIFFQKKNTLRYGKKRYYKIVGPFEDYAKIGFQKGQTTLIEHLGEGDIIRGIVPLSAGSEKAVLVISHFVPLRLAKKLEEIRSYYTDYKSVKPLKKPLKNNYFTIFILMTLMILFGASWFGIYLSKQISTPISELVVGTEMIANGDYNVHVSYPSNDEIGRLVDSFNKMVLDVKTANNNLDRAYSSLKERNAQIREKQEYIEIVLRNVSTGVIAMDRKGVITTFNDYAQKLLGIKAQDVMGKRYKDFVEDIGFKDGIREIIEEMGRKSLSTIERNLAGKFQGKELFLRINISLLKGLDDKYMGVVVVFDDLSELQKIHRTTAWREVARRIAHEIKNPLTPIHLSAQRLNKRYVDYFKSDNKEKEIFSNCTNMIIDQVCSIKKMVNEFAEFARMPASNPSFTSLNEIIEEVLHVYKQGAHNVNIEYHNFSTIDNLYLDRDQIKRVFINLIDNSIAAFSNVKGPEIQIIVSSNKILEMVSIEVIDNGTGIAPGVMDRLFEPYFSTKGSKGTGLGLTIVKQIIIDHAGYIRVSSSNDSGAKFLIELPTYQYERLTRVSREVIDEMERGNV